jgi:hypothetical protein
MSFGPLAAGARAVTRTNVSSSLLGLRNRHPGSAGSGCHLFPRSGGVKGCAKLAPPERVFRRRVFGAGTFAAVMAMSEDELFAGREGRVAPS